MTLSSGCPDQETVEKLLDDRLPAAERDALFAHLEHCPSCAFREEISAPWSMKSLVGRKRAGAVTQLALSDLAGRAPMSKSLPASMPPRRRSLRSRAWSTSSWSPAAGWGSSLKRATARSTGQWR